jgi:protein SCO1/2
VTNGPTSTRRAFIAGATASFVVGAAQAEEWVSTRSAGDLMDAVMWSREVIGGPFSLINHHGARVTERDFAGRVLVVYFGFLSCPDICPAELLSIAQAIEKLGPAGDAIQPIFITLDPDRDTGQALADYVSAIHPRLVGLTGRKDEIRRAADVYRVYFAKAEGPGGNYSIDHMGFVYIMGADGRYVGFLPPGTPLERMTEVFSASVRRR